MTAHPRYPDTDLPPDGNAVRYAYDRAVPRELPGEVWRPISGYERLYEVSNRGRVRRIATKGRGRRLVRPRLMKPQMATGYPAVTLSIGKRRRRFHIHVLVARAFIGPRPAGMQVAHLDGINGHVSVDNLAYATPLENSQHMRFHGTVVEGARHPLAVLTEQDVRDIREARRRGEQLCVIARRYPVLDVAVSRAATGQSWACLNAECPPVRNAPQVARGTMLGQAKLTDDAVRKICGRLDRGESIKAIARDNGVSPSAIANIRDGWSWCHVSGKTPAYRKRGRGGLAAKAVAPVQERIL